MNGVPVVELIRLQKELAAARAQERALRATRRAVLNLLEDLDEDRQKLARAEAQWRAAFDGIRDAIFMHDIDLRIVRANRAYAALAGMQAQATLGKPYWQVFPREERPKPLCPEPGATSCEREITVDGRVFRSRAAMIFDDDGRYQFSVHILEDITERRRAEQALELRTHELAQANSTLKKALDDLRTAEKALVQTERLSAIGTVASSVAHELNNPLMGIMTYVGYVRGKIGEPALIEVLASAEQELSRIERMVRNLLELGRPAGESVHGVAVKDAIDRALALLAADLRQASVEVIVTIAPDLPLVWGNEGPLQQVFLNLLLNARDAVFSQPERRIAIDVGCRQDRVRVLVHDTGPGVAPEHIERLFEPFFTTKPEGKGTGLGLAVSQQIINGFGGTLSYVPGGPGATFVAELRRYPF